MSEHWHGTVNGYKRHKCRCDECRAAHRERQKAQYAAWRLANPLPPRTRRPHGTETRYNAGCRCTLCRAAHTLKARARRGECEDDKRWNAHELPQEVISVPVPPAPAPAPAKPRAPRSAKPDAPPVTFPTIEERARRTVLRF